MKAWILIGMMGAGKSTVGKRLAELSGREYLDTDQLIVNRLGKPVDRIFEQYGQQTFRDHEASIISSLEPGAKVISTGGGAVVRDENFDALKRIGVTIYLKVSPEQLIERLKMSRKKRPLLMREDWEQEFSRLYQDRSAIYEKSELTIELDNLTMEEAAEKLFAELTS
jgi:shikimate kinase